MWGRFNMLTFADVPELFQQKADTFQVNIGLNVTDVTSVTLFCSYGGRVWFCPSSGERDPL